TWRRHREARGARAQLRFPGQPGRPGRPGRAGRGGGLGRLLPLGPHSPARGHARWPGRLRRRDHRQRPGRLRFLAEGRRDLVAARAVLARPAARVGRRHRGGTAVPMSDSFDAVVIGAACAYYLARSGLRVAVAERGTVAAGTTGAGEGNILISDKEPGPELELARLSQRLWRELGD